MGINVEIGLKDNGFSASMRAVNAELRTTDKYISEVDTSIKQLGKSEDSLKQKMDALESKTESLNRKMQLQADRLEKGENKVKEYKTALQNLDRTSETYEADVKTLTQAIEKQELANSKLSVELKTTRQQLKNVENASEQCKSELNNFGRAVDTSETSVSSFNQTLSRIDFVAVGMAIQNCGSMMASFGKNIVNGFINGLDESKEFTAELETQQFLLQQLPDDVQKLVKELGQVSIEFGFNERQGEKVATDLASFFERSDIADKIDLSEVFKRALDLSAMYDLDVDDVVERIKKMMMGNFENSDALGFNMNVSSIEEFLDLKWDKLSYAEKQVKALEYIMMQTESTSGRATQEAKGFASQWNLAKDSINEVKNTIWSYMQDAMLPLIQKFNEFVGPLKNWIMGHKELATIIGIVVVAIGGLLAVIGSLLVPIGTIMMMMPVIQSALSGLGAVIGAICSPIGLVVVAIGALVGGLVLAYNKCEWFKNGVDTAWEFIKEKIQSVIDFVTPYIQQFLEWLPKAWENATNFISYLWANLSPILTSYFQYISDKAQEIWNALTAFWEENGAWITNLFNSIWNGIQTFLTDTFKFISDVAKDVFGYLQEFWNKHGETVMNLFSLVWSSISNYVSTVWNTIKTIATTVFNALKAFWQQHGDSVKTIFSNAWQVIVAVLNTAWATIKTIVKTGVDIVMGVIDVLMKLLKGDFKGAWESAKNIVKNVVDNIFNFVGDIINAWRGISDKIAGFFSGIGNKIMAHFPSWLKTLINGGNPFKGMISNAVSGISGLFNFSRSASPQQDMLVTPHNDMSNAFTDSVISLRDVSSTPYLYSDSAESKAWNNAFNTTTYNYNSSKVNQSSNISDGDMVTIMNQQTKLLEIIANKVGIGLHIENFNNNREIDIPQLWKELGYYGTLHGQKY